MKDASRAAISASLAALKDGERSAARPAFTALWPPLVAFARRFLDESQAEEAAQRALVRLFGQIGRYDPTRDGLSWGFALVAWEVRSLMRDQARAAARRAPVDAAASAALDDPEAYAVQQQLRALLDDAVAGLPDLDRAAVLALLDDAGDGPPLAARLRQRRRRALLKLRSLWRELYGEP